MEPNDTSLALDLTSDVRMICNFTHVKKRSHRTLRLVRRQKEIEREIQKDGEAVLNDLVVARESRIHHRGVFACSHIPRGRSIIEYVGEKVSKTEALRRGTHKGSVYLFHLNRQVDIDGRVGGNGAHLINHSCEPNARSEWDENRVHIIAKRSIRPGEEITYNYGFDEDDCEKHPCRCGAARCCGYMLSPEAWKRVQKQVNGKDGFPS